MPSEPSSSIVGAKSLPANPTGDNPPAAKSKSSATRTKAHKFKPAPLPATVNVHGYEITIPNTKSCWCVNILHSCGHPVREISEVRYPGCDKPLVVEITRHSMRACTGKCKVEGMDHKVNDLCEFCLQLSAGETEQAGRPGAADARLYHGMPLFQ